MAQVAPVKGGLSYSLIVAVADRSRMQAAGSSAAHDARAALPAEPLIVPPQLFGNRKAPH